MAETLEADWNTALRALDDTQATYDKARQQNPGQLTEQQKARNRQLVTNLPGIWNNPATPARERKRIARLLLTDVTITRTSDTITAHIRLAGGPTCTLTLPAPRPGWAIRQTPPPVIAAIDELLDHHTHADIAAILNQRGLTSGEGRPFHPLIIRNIRDNYQLRSRQQRLRNAGMLTLTPIATLLGVSTGTIKIWRTTPDSSPHTPTTTKASASTHRQAPNPPARAQGRKLTQRRLTAPLTRNTPTKMSDPTATV